MGFLDNAKKSLTKVVDQHGETIEKGAGKLGDAINQRTGGKHADKVTRGREQLRRGMDGLGTREPRSATDPVDRRDDRQG